MESGLRTTGKYKRRAWMPVAVAVVAVALVAAAPAGASHRFTGIKAQRSVYIAWGFWHSLVPTLFERRGYSCAPENVHLDWERSLGDAMAHAYIGGCLLDRPTIQLETTTIVELDEITGCAVIVHEFGHLLGYRHVAAPGQLMSGDRTLGHKPPQAATWKRARSRCARKV